MKVASLDPLAARPVDFPKTYLGAHDVLVTSEAGKAPAGVEDAEAVVWSNYPVDAAFIASLLKLRFIPRSRQRPVRISPT